MKTTFLMITCMFFLYMESNEKEFISFVQSGNLQMVQSYVENGFDFKNTCVQINSDKKIPILSCAIYNPEILEYLCCQNVCSDVLSTTLSIILQDLSIVNNTSFIEKLYQSVDVLINKGVVIESKNISDAVLVKAYCFIIPFIQSGCSPTLFKEKKYIYIYRLAWIW